MQKTAGEASENVAEENFDAVELNENKNLPQVIFDETHKFYAAPIFVEGRSFEMFVAPSFIQSAYVGFRRTELACLNLEVECEHRSKITLIHPETNLKNKTIAFEYGHKSERGILFRANSSIDPSSTSYEKQICSTTDLL